MFEKQMALNDLFSNKFELQGKNWKAFWGELRTFKLPRASTIKQYWLIIYQLLTHNLPVIDMFCSKMVFFSFTIHKHTILDKNTSLLQNLYSKNL